MTTLNVQFTDSSKATIESYFAGPQDGSVFPNLGTVETNDPKQKSYYDGMTATGVIGLPMPE